MDEHERIEHTLDLLGLDEDDALTVATDPNVVVLHNEGDTYGLTKVDPGGTGVIEGIQFEEDAVPVLSSATHAALLHATHENMSNRDEKSLRELAEHFDLVA